MIAASNYLNIRFHVMDFIEDFELNHTLNLKTGQLFKVIEDCLIEYYTKLFSERYGVLNSAIEWSTDSYLPFL